MAGNVKLHHVEAGAGTAIVLLHGFPLTCEIWKRQRDALADRYRVITPDLRGHGRSPVTAGAYEMDLLAGDVFALLDELHIDRAILMGHSMGGYVALAGWKRAPNRFLGLGLIASQAGADTEEGRQGRFKLAEKVRAEGSQVVAEAMLPKLFAVDPSERMKEIVGDMMRNTAADGIVGALQGMAGRPDSTGALAGIGVPTLVVAGEKDRIIPIDKARAMAAALPKATLASLDAGHMPMLEQPEATTRAIRSFAESL